MKKTLLATTLLVALAFSTNASNAFCWGYLNPANWGCPCEKVCQDNCSCKPKCNRCHKQKCKCNQHKQKCDPCQTQNTCNPCQKTVAPCDACDKIQQDMAK